jgi:hypothetical protein
MQRRTSYWRLLSYWPPFGCRHINRIKHRPSHWDAAMAETRLLRTKCLFTSVPTMQRRSRSAFAAPRLVWLCSVSVTLPLHSDTRQNFDSSSLNSDTQRSRLTLILLMWTIWRAPTNASKWRMGFNSAFKGLI